MSRYAPGGASDEQREQAEDASPSAATTWLPRPLVLAAPFEIRLPLTSPGLALIAHRAVRAFGGEVHRDPLLALGLASRALPLVVTLLAGAGPCI